MSEYLKKGVIDNPQNIKRVGGDLPTSQSSNKNIFLLIAVAGGMALSFTTVWAYLNYYTGSTPLTIFIILVVYTPIIAKTLSVTLFDEAGNKKAYIDQMENEISSLSTIWEIQNIREVSANEDNIGFIDFIDGSRSIIMTMIMGSTMNQPEAIIKSHYDSIERVLNRVDSLGYQKNLYIADESISDDLAMNFYYKSINEIDDEKYVKVFTAMLDHIDLVTKVKGSVVVLYLEVTGWGANKHIMFRDLASLPEDLGSDHLFVSSYLLDKKGVSHFLANDSSINSFDIEELKLLKYRNSTNMGRSAVLEARNDKGETTKVFNPKFEAKNNITVRSVSMTGRGGKNKQTEMASHERLKRIEESRKQRDNLKERSRVKFTEQTGEDYKVNKLPERETFLRLMQDSDEVVLGSSNKANLEKETHNHENRNVSTSNED